MSRTPTIADLYKEEIYQIANQVLIILPDSWESLADTERTLLSKILGALNLSLDAVQIVSHKHFQVSSIKQFASKWVLQFSSEPSNELDYYTVGSTEGCAFVKSHALNDLDDARKKSLWTALKSLKQA